MLNPNFYPFPVIETERLLLRQLHQDDVQALFEMRGDPEAMRYIDRPLAQNLDDAQKLYDNITHLLNANEGINWAITLKPDPVMIGTICLFEFKKKDFRAEIGYLLNPHYHRRGIMQEAIVPVLNYGFDILKLHSIEANINPDNIASTSLVERNGFVREAYFKEIWYSKGRFIDTTIYTLLEQDWNKNRQAV